MVKVIHNKSLFLLFLAGLFLPASNAFADNNTTDFSITVNPSLSLSVSSSTVGFEITPTQAGAYNSSSFNVYSSTNNATGYTLTMSTGKVNLESNTINPNTGSKPTIPTLTETQDGITAAQFEASTDSSVLNHYGVSIAGSNYNAMKTEKEIKKTSVNNTTEDTTAIALASKLDLLTVPGVYSTTLNFSLVANPIDPVQPYPEDPCNSNPDCDATSGVTLQRAYEIAYTNAHKGMYEEDTAGSGTFHYVDSWNGVAYEGNGRDVRFLIQDMTPEICATATAINSQALVLDTRDQSSYYIVKAADGRCWMQDNLALDLLDSTVQSNMSSSNTNANATALNALFNGSATDKLATAAVKNWTSYQDDSYIIPVINASSKTTVPNNNNDPLASIVLAGGWKTGVFYNYCAASAGSYCIYRRDAGYDRPNTAIDAEYDICPTGWRMPTDGHKEEEGLDADEFSTLYMAYPAISGGDNQYTRFRKALHLPLSGTIYSGQVSDQGYTAGFWSSTLFDTGGGSDEYDGISMYSFWSGFWQGEGTFGRDFIHRDEGSSVRCIAKTGTEPTPSGN